MFVALITIVTIMIPINATVKFYTKALTKQ